MVMADTFLVSLAVNQLEGGEKMGKYTLKEGGKLRI